MDRKRITTSAELFDLAVSHHQGGNLQEAEACCRQVIRADPAHADAHHLLGLIAAHAGRFPEAVTLLRQAVALNPVDAGAHFNLALAHVNQGQVEAAIACFRQVLHLDPHHDQAHNNLGNALLDQGQLAEALECYRQALQSNPDNASAHYNLASALMKQERMPEAITHCREAVRIDPQFADAYNNLGNALQHEGAAAEALACYRQALACNPRLGKAHINMGKAVVRFGHLQEAQNHYEQALQLLPGNATALWNRALLRLAQGDFDGGWPDYEQRWALPGIAVRSFEEPRWDGSSFEDKTILVYAEQGLGDTIQFLRYLPLVKKRGGTVLFECHAPLLRLCAGVGGADRVIPMGAPLPPFDVQVPLLSLAGIFRTTTATIPKDVPYLHADSRLVEYWRRELAPLTGIKVGIAWQGNPKNKDDRYRSVPLALFANLARRKDIRLISLQKGGGAEQIRECAHPLDNPRDLNEACSLGKGTPIVDFRDRLDRDGAFIDTAAIMMNLDLVVTVDNAIAHLAGALGVPTWTLLLLAPDWRWLLGREDSPWYLTMRLFRQRRFGDWSEVFERVHEELGHGHGNDRGTI